MIFISSPYSHPDPTIRKTRYRLACDFVVHLMNSENLIAFSPIVYGHELSSIYSVPTDAQFWLAFNTNMLRRCEAMFELQLTGWEDSKGMHLERNIARMLGIPHVEYDSNFNNLTELRAKFDAMKPSIIVPQ